MDNVNRRFKTRAEREEEEKKKRTAGGVMLPTYEELTAIEEKAKEDAAAAVSSEKGLDFFQKPSNWDDGYQFGDVTKTALGTLGDVGVNVVKGAVRLGEGVGDAAQFGAAAVADLFGADDKAEAIRRNAQRDKVTEAFSDVDEKLNKYSVLGRTSDAAAESLGQIGGILATGGIAGALNAGAVGATAATTGLMGLSSFGSGTSEAYEAGAKEGEAEAYGAIAGAADALSEMIFGGLGKGFKALGLSKGITSADDVLAKAVTSKIRNTLAKNTVQMGIKAGAEGLEEVLAGTMQAAGKKATYMSERDFADILADENLLEQFVVGSMASGITQVPSYVSANRAGADLVSDGGAEDAQGKFADLRDKYADFSEIERTGLASGAKDDDIRMAGELSSALGKKIRFFREEAKNGTINNGEYHEDTDEIWINARSKNVKAQIVAHELTHSIEKHDGYQQLVNMAMEKLEAEQKAKGKTIDDLYRQKELLYADGNVRLGSYEEITSELVAEFVEKRLLTDEKSIKSLVSENRTLGQRIREWFDSLLAKMGNASAKERDYIRQMRDVYARALGETTSTAGDGVQYSIKRTKNIPYSQQIQDIESGRLARSDSLYIGEPSDALKTAGFSNNPFAMDQGDYRKSRRNAGNNKHYSAHNVPKTFFDDMQKYLSEAPLVIENGDKASIITSFPMTDTKGEPSFVIAGVWKDNKMDSDTVNHVKSVYPRDGIADYIRKAAETGRLKVVNEEKANNILSEVGIDTTERQNIISFSGNSISQNGGNVNSKFSVSRVTQDSDGRQLSEGQQEYFRDSKVTDANGNLKVMYHGTSKGGHTVFDPYGKARYGLFGAGSYFTDNREIGESYTKKGRGNNPQVYETYLNITNPIDMDAQADPAAWQNALPDAYFPDSGTNEDFYRAMEEYFEDNEYPRWEAAQTAMEVIEGMGYDGITHIGGGRVNEDGLRHRVYIAFQPEQIKNVDNMNPTKESDIRHSISAVYDEAVRRNTPGVKDAEETAQINEEIERVDLNYDSESGTVYHSFSSLEDAFDYNEGEEEYRAARNEYAYALAKATGKTYAQAQQYLDDLFLIHDLIGDDRDRLDYVAAVDRSSWVGNVEYGGSIDFSTLCAKRRLFTGTFDAIQQALPDTVLNENDFLRIRELLVEKGLESPCSMCYVEGSRAKHGVYVERFLRDYLATDPEWRPQIADFTSTTRLEQTRIQHPEAYKAYTDAMNKLSQRKPKEASVRTDYKGEILRAFKNDGNVNAKNLMGGIRFNSFSDFEIIHAIDVMQVLTDMARVGLHGQSYTKQKEFAEAFGNTGLKINLSLVAKDVDADGRLIFDEVNGMKEAEAMDIRGRYSENVGTVIVVFNEAQLRAALADERIDFVLPFHRSQWKKSQYAMMGLPAETRDFTNIQNDRMKNPKTGRAKKVDTGNIMPNQYWDPSLDGRGNAQLYLDYINENDYIPKFDFLLTKQDGKWVLPEGAIGDGYFKLLIDFKMYDNDGNGAPQRPVTPDFNMPYITKMLEDYKGGHGSFPVANDIVDTFVREKQGGRVKHSVSREDASVTEAETDQTLQQIRNDIAADEARYRELSDIVMSNERFNAMMLDEQNAILDEMQSLRERIDRANQIMQDMSYEQDMGVDVPMPGDEDAPLQRRSAQAEYGEPETVEVAGEEDPKLTRKVLHKNIMDRIKERFSERGFDFDKVLAKAKDLSTFATVDNTPQRVMEKSLGYKEGRELSDLTIDQAARNETEGIRWLNGFTDKKDGVLAKLSKKYNIKPGSKESAAAQMYAEGFYVSDKNEIVEYGDRELAADFPDAQVRENIKGLAHDPIIRQIYDETLDAINASRTRNAFPEIQKLDNYYLHFRAMDDTFSRLGIPFNPNDIRAKDLPTDLNGVTADLKPGQPYFASAKHRLGKRTSFDLLGGMEKYLTSAKNQIYHIDDIQTLRALRNYVADMYGQAEGLSNLDDLSDEEVEARIKDVYGSHLSTFAKFLNEEANVLAGKTSLIDRGLEGVIGRRGITFLNDVNRQVGANMVGYNISSSLTNFLAPVQAFAKMNKAAFVKGFAQTVENRMKSITGNGDDFAEKSDVIVRRKGADRFHRTAWQKMSDPGYLLMGMVDDISTEIIARAKYNELTAKGMDAKAANRETDKWVSRLMGDRSLGQMPQIFNSKMLGLVTKFQLEVRNQLDSQFYDTIKEAQVQYEEIGDKAKRNAKTAAKVAAIFAELALAQHVFGSVFESIAGYNPAFDIIEVIATVLGLDDDEESEDTALDNIEQGVLALIEDLPYSSVIMDGGRIPVSSAMPIGEIIKGQDEYGNDINRLKTVAEAVPYYALPGGYGQIKKTAKGLSMFSGEKAVTGSYTDSGNLRFPVEATPGNIAQAAVFGQWANENARDYFNNERTPANERQTRGYSESGLEWDEYTKYRNQISKLDKDADKLALIDSLKIDTKAKEALYRWLVASAKKDDDGNIIGSSEDDRLAVLYDAGLDFDDYAASKLKQAELNADENLSANQRATRFYAWAANAGYTDEQTDVITDQFKFSSGFKVEPTTYNKLVDGGVTADNAVLVTDALSGTSRAIDKINAVWSTGLTGTQLDNAVKAVVTEGWYERYRKVIDANVPLDVLTWVLDNADQNGNDSIDNEERTLILSQLALSRKELAALWEATGGSEKSNPYKSGSGTGVSIEMPEVKMPELKMPEINVPYFGF